MAISHVNIDTNDPYLYPRKARKMIDSGNDFLELLREISAIGNRMVDGSDYTEVETRFKLPVGTGASFLGEINSVLGKIDTDASVSNVKAAIAQLFAILG